MGDLAIAEISSPSQLSFEGVGDTGAGEVSGEPQGGDSQESEGLAESDLAELNDPGEVEPSAQEEQEADAQEKTSEPADVQEEALEESGEGEELPEGVKKVTLKNGKEGYYLQKNRYELFHGAHKSLRELSEIAGQPLTAQVLDGFQRAHIAQERLYSDLLSGDPQSQGKVLDFWMQEALGEQQAGNIEKDPITPLAETFYDKIQASHPDAYAHLRMKAATDLISELYGEAQRSKSKALFLSAGHVAKALGMAYKKDPEMVPFFNSPQQASESASLAGKVRDLEAQLQGRTQSERQVAYKSWEIQTNQKIGNSILREGILPEVEESSKLGLWAKDQKAFQEHVISPLQKGVDDALRKDERFLSTIRLLEANAQRATPQRRNELGQQIIQQYVQRARLAAEALKPGILRDAAKRISSSSQAVHDRRAKGIGKVSPSNGSSVKKSLVPRNDLGQYEVATHDNLLGDLRNLLK